MAFTAKDVQALREMTGVGMMDCKKALVASDGDMDKAVEFLREKGLAAAQKKASRIAAEGVVTAIVNDKGIGAVVEVNSETDFVAKNDTFQAFVKDIANVVADNDPADLDALMAMQYPGTDLTITQMQQEKVLVIGENIKVRRFARYCDGLTVPYIHAGGKIGVLVNMEVSDNIRDNPTVFTLGKDLAMQAAAMRPTFLDKSDVPNDVIEKEKEILIAQIKEDPKNASKPDNIIEKMVTGRIGKYYEENCLMQQAFVKGDKESVEQHVSAVAKELNGTIKIKGFVRFEKGEGLEKRQDNFADEVASMVK